MIKYKTIWVVLILLILIVIIKLNYVKKVLNEDVSINQYEQQVQKLIDSLECGLLNTQIVDQKVFLGNDSLDKTDFSNFNQEKYIYFHFSYNTCPPCILSTIDLLKEIYSGESNDNIIFISSNYPSRFRNDCYGKRLLTIESLGFTEYLLQVPILFTLTNDLKIDKVNVVNKNDFSRTRNFLINTRLKSSR